MKYHLAQFNVATGFGLSSEPVMLGFMERLDEVNAVADRSPGFVWRLKTAAGNATAILPYNNKRILINLSVWESIRDFRQFVYTTIHGEMVRDGRIWFEPKTEPQIVMWWIPAGELPTVDEAVDRLAFLRSKGSSSEAFSLRSTFPPPGDSGWPAGETPTAGRLV